MTWIDLTATNSFHQYLFEAPVDEGHTRIFFLNMRNFLLEPEKDGPIHARNKIIAQQDKMRLEGKDYVVRDGDVIYFRFNV